MNDTNIIEKLLTEIENTIEKTINGLGAKYKRGQNIYDVPEPIYGDYTTNVAMIYAKELKLNPENLASKLIEKLSKDEKIIGNINSIVLMPVFEIARPGFINIKLNDQIIRAASEYVGKVHNEFTGKNVLVEHSSPNLFKPFSIGHLMNNIIGEATQRIMKSCGANVETMSFPSNVSLGIAKALMVIQNDIESKNVPEFFSKILNEFSDDIDNDRKTSFNNEEINKNILYFGNAYVRGVKDCEDNVEKLVVAKKILNEIYNLRDNNFYKIFALSQQISERYFKNVLTEFGTNALKHGFVYESWAGEEGLKIIYEYIGEDKVFEQSDGAIIYTPDESRKDIHTSVFINSQGYPTYDAKDLGLIKIKMSGKLSAAGITNFYPVYSFTITDNEQISHFKVVFDAAIAIAKYNEDQNRSVSEFGDWGDWVRKSYHIPHGRMLFKGQKMSSRLGGVPLALDVIEVVSDEVRERLGEKVANHTDDEKKKLIHEVAMSALRIAVLRAKPGININFDPDTSLSFEGDSGPYLLYTHARCASLIDKGLEQFGANINTLKYNMSIFFDKNIEVSSLERELLHYNEVLKSCVKFEHGKVDVEPQKLVSHLFRVAREFNSFYGNTQIITEDEKLTRHYLKIVLWTKEVMKHGLNILGIEAQERM